MIRRVLPLLLALVAVPASAQFTEQTFLAGLGGISNTNGVAVADYDRDGDLDVYVVARAAYDPTAPETWNRLFRNDGRDAGGDVRFRDVTLPSGLEARTSGTEADTRNFGHKYVAAWGDYDGDGWPDLFLGHLGPDQLFRNNGDGTFTEVTAEAGVSGGEAGGGYVTTSALWWDPDHDGDLDLYVGAWWDYGAGRNLRNRLYENQGDGTFEDVSAASGLDDLGATWTALPFDADLDGWTDLYLATDVDTLTGIGVNKLYRNQGDGSFEDVTDAYGLGDENYGMGLALGDPDRNGLFDLYLTNVATPSRFQRNPLWVQTGPGVFEDVAEAAGVDIAGWGWGTEFLDLENDGDEDLVVVTGLFDPDYPNYLFRNDGAPGATPSFVEAAGALGVDDAQAARGLAVFDYDGDGDEDLIVSNVFRAPYLYENTDGAGAWLQVELEGTLSNRDGLGASVTAWTDGVPHAKLKHGAQYLAQNLVPVHLGLGAASTVDSLVVRWPSGHVDRFEDVPAGRRVRVVEAQGFGAPTAGEEGPMPPGLEVRVGPNPARGAVTFRVEAPARLAVVDALGRRVVEAEGRGPFVWDAGDAAPGVYVWRVEAGGAVRTGRVVVAR